MTKTFKFRKLERGDLPLLLELKNETGPYTHRVTLNNMDDQVRWFEGLRDHPHQPANLVLVGLLPWDAGPDIKEPAGLFKILNIDWPNRRAEVGWDMFNKFRGRGYGKALAREGVAFCKEVLGLRRLRGDILATNPASIRCAEAAGFVREGTERQAVLKNGSPVDSHVYGVILSGSETWAGGTG